MADVITIDKSLIGVEDLQFATAGQVPTTFQVTGPDGNPLTLTQISASNIPFAAVAKNLEDLVDGGFDLKIKPNAIGATGSIIPIADVTGKNLHDLFDGGYDVPIKPQYVHHKFDTKSTGYTATVADAIIEVNASTGNVTINLPTAVGIQSKIYMIVKIDSTANTVTIDPNGSQTINGDTTRVLNYQYEMLVVHSDNANWKEHIPSKAMIAVQTTPSAVPVRDVTRDLIVQTNVGTPNSKVDIDADEINLHDAAGAFFKATSVNLTADITVPGANGLDTGGEAGNTWYYIWVIYNSTSSTTASLLSTQTAIGSLTLPTGYSFGALVGAVRNNVGSNFLPFYQQGLDADFNAIQTIKSGATFTGTTWTAVTVSAFFPATAKRARYVFACVDGGLGMSPRSDGHAGAYINAIATVDTGYGILAVSRQSVVTLECRYAATSYYFTQNVTSELYALGWSY